MSPYDGPLEGQLKSDGHEVLRDLTVVVDAARLKNVKLTKSGIPPKPLWSTMNEGLLWSDPREIMHDWDEVDQVRLIYYLALKLGIIQIDVDRQIVVGPGADRFFFASSTRRSAEVMRAYVEVEDWDERCDARNEHGHRMHFGQTFRRDFVLSASEVREAVIAALQSFEVGPWFFAEELATRLTRDVPNMLMAEDDSLPDIPADGPNEEILRYTDYWLFLAARFGWVNLARTPGDIENTGKRVFQLTELTSRLTQETTLGDDGLSERYAARPFVIQPNGDVVLYRDLADPADEFLLRRIANIEALPPWDQPVVTYSVTPESLQAARDDLVSAQSIRSLIIERASQDVPQTFSRLVDDLYGGEPVVEVEQGMTVVEFPTEERAGEMSDEGFETFGRFVIVNWDRWHDFSQLLGGEPPEGFAYPPIDEPLGSISREKLRMEWPVLPLAARELLEALQVAGDPPEAALNQPIIDRLGPGWTLASVAEGLKLIADGDLPPWLGRALKN